MNYEIFISYAGADMDLIENFQDRLKGFGVTSWVYSIDATLSEKTWKEIEKQIHSCPVMIFAVSSYTDNAEGQKKELEILLEKYEKLNINSQFFPLALRDTPFPLFPEKLHYVNGARIDAYNVRTVAFEIANRFFPQLFEEHRAKDWKIPVPGEWLEVVRLHENIEEFFEIGDVLYFKSISPMGLFECYAPKVESLFWIAPEYVKSAIVTDEIKTIERNMPSIYTTSGQNQIEAYGWDVWRNKQQ